MAWLFNLLWIVIGGGFLLWLEYVLAGLLLCLTVIGIPFGLQCFKLARLSLLPFGRDVAELRTSGGALQLTGNVLWLLLAGIWIFLTHVGLALVLAVTIIGLPFAVQHMKLAMLALMPFGKVTANRHQ